MKKIIYLSAICMLCSLQLFAQDTAMADTAMPDTAMYKEYLGRYTFPDGSPISEATIAMEDTTLSITAEQGTAYMTQLGKDSFSMAYEDGRISFKRDSASQQVNKLIIYVSGMEMEGTKEQHMEDMESMPVKDSASKEMKKE